MLKCRAVGTLPRCPPVSRWKAGMRALVLLHTPGSLVTLELLKCGLNICLGYNYSADPSFHSRSANHSFHGWAENGHSYQTSYAILSKARVWRCVPLPQDARPRRTEPGRLPSKVSSSCAAQSLSCVRLLREQQPATLLCRWDFPGKSAGGGCLLQGIELTSSVSPTLQAYSLAAEPSAKPILSLGPI